MFKRLGAFKRLRTKLTILYAGLFGISLFGLALTVQLAVSSNAERVVRGELEANGLVFDRLWEMRAKQMSESAGLLSRDFGFRAAVSTHDGATIRSALLNLGDRLGVERAFVVEEDGGIIGLDAPIDKASADSLWRTLDEAPTASGVLMLRHLPYQAVAAPIRAPDVIGWVVFASRLDRANLSALQTLAAIPVQANVFVHGPTGDWTSPDFAPIQRDYRALQAFFVSQSSHGAARGAQKLATPEGPAIALLRPLHSLTRGDREAAALMLRYPLALALAPYKGLLLVMAAIGALGVALLFYGSWALANTLTRPITALEQAAQQLQRGEMARVEVQSSDEIGRLAQSFNVMADEIQAREKHIRHLASHDLETDLPNRRAIEDALRARYGRAEHGVFAILAIGVDRFHHIRGAIGYALASQLIREVGLRIAQCFPEACVARMSTETLGVAIGAADRTELLAIAQKLPQTLDLPVRLDGGALVDVCTSIGIALYENGAPSAAINQASIAVDQARRVRAKAAFFDADAYGDPANNLSLISELFDAIATGDITLFHQPKYDIRKGCITGVEALMRWRHPRRGMIPPDLFIPMLEETGHIYEVTEWTLRQAIADQKVMREAGHDLKVSVNLSGRLVGDATFTEHALAQITRERGDICMEITETAVIDNAELALKTVDRFMRAGVDVSIDDYGAGLSSLAYLKQIRADELKIDKSLILSAADSNRDALLVKSTIDLAHALGMKVTAEGVETAALVALLTNMGCDRAQGYFIGHPAPLEVFLNSLKVGGARFNVQALRA